MVYIIEPKDILAGSPCPELCRKLCDVKFCAIKPLYGVPI